MLSSVEGPPSAAGWMWSSSSLHAPAPVAVRADPRAAPLVAPPDLPPNLGRDWLANGCRPPDGRRAIRGRLPRPLLGGLDGALPLAVLVDGAANRLVKHGREIAVRDLVGEELGELVEVALEGGVDGDSERVRVGRHRADGGTGLAARRGGRYDHDDRSIARGRRAGELDLGRA